MLELTFAKTILKTIFQVNYWRKRHVGITQYAVMTKSFEYSLFQNQSHSGIKKNQQPQTGCIFIGHFYSAYSGHIQWEKWRLSSEAGLCCMCQRCLDMAQNKWPPALIQQSQALSGHPSGLMGWPTDLWSVRMFISYKYGQGGVWPLILQLLIPMNKIINNRENCHKIKGNFFWVGSL